MATHERRAAFGERVLDDRRIGLARRRILEQPEELLVGRVDLGASRFERRFERGPHTSHEIGGQAASLVSQDLGAEHAVDAWRLPQQLAGRELDPRHHRVREADRFAAACIGALALAGSVRQDWPACVIALDPLRQHALADRPPRRRRPLDPIKVTQDRRQFRFGDTQLRKPRRERRIVGADRPSPGADPRLGADRVRAKQRRTAAMKHDPLGHGERARDDFGREVVQGMACGSFAGSIGGSVHRGSRVQKVGTVPRVSSGARVARLPKTPLAT